MLDLEKSKFYLLSMKHASSSGSMFACDDEGALTLSEIELLTLWLLPL